MKPPRPKHKGPPRPAHDRGPARPANDRGPARPANDRGPARPANDRGPAHDRGPARPANDRGPARHDKRPAHADKRPADGRGASPADKPRRPPERKDPHSAQDFFVDGLAAVAEYARFKPSAILFVEAAPAHKAAAERALREHGVALGVAELPKRDASEHEFAPVRARVRIQALDAAALEKRLENREKDLIIALDHITDPRNLGAIVRTAAFFGVQDVIAPERRQVLLTQASVATAQGGFALTELTCVVNLSRALDELKERGYWIVGTAMDGLPYEKIVGKYEKLVLVLGSEDAGMAQKVRERCDLLCAIPNKGRGLESLNVSVAAGIFLSALAPTA